MAEAQDVNFLKRRGRRRLVGAIALVLLAVIVLPMVFDSEPGQSAPPVSVRIPNEEDAGFSPKVTPKGPAASQPPAAPAEPPKAAAAPAPKVAAAPAPKPEAKAAEKPAPEKLAAAEAERARAQAALAGGGQFVVPVAALASADKVQELAAKLKEAKLPYYTEPLATVKGPVTRVRAGPFASREAAEKAQRQLKRLGLKPGNVVAKS